METIIVYLGRKLREAGPTRWAAISERCGVSKSLPRKIAYGDRVNPGVQTVQPMVDYFQAVDRGELELPPPCAAGNRSSAHGEASGPF